MTNIGKSAFGDCDSLAKVSIPEGVTIIGDSAFQSCSGLTAVTIPEGVANIGNWAFSGCSGLTAVTIPNSVTNIGGSAFESCSSLRAVVFLGEPPTFGHGVFLFCAISTAVVPEGSREYFYEALSGTGTTLEVEQFIEFDPDSTTDADGVSVPNVWLLAYPTLFLDEEGNFLKAGDWGAPPDFASVAASMGTNGVPVYQSYVAGLNPVDPSSRFTASIAVTNGAPVVTWTPDLGTDRAYTVEGKIALTNATWGAMNGTSRFFRVKVEMPDLLGGVQLWENGPYWAECNVGATKPEEYGYYFWWGDTVGHMNMGSRWVSVKDGASISFADSGTAASTYGKDNSTLLSEGWIDSTGNLVASHDAATAHRGSPWRMPTSDEIGALVNNCTTEWTTTNGVAGRRVTGKGDYSDRSIFIPAAGYGDDSSLIGPGSYGNFWSSTPYSDDCATHGASSSIRATSSGATTLAVTGSLFVLCATPTRPRFDGRREF